MERCWALRPSDRPDIHSFVRDTTLIIATLTQEMTALLNVNSLVTEAVVEMVVESFKTKDRDLMLLALKLVCHVARHRQPEEEPTKLARLFRYGPDYKEEKKEETTTAEAKREEKKEEKKEEKSEETLEVRYFCQLVIQFTKDPTFLESLVLALYRVADKVPPQEKEWMMQSAITPTLELLSSYPTQTVLAENASGLFEYLTVRIPGCKKIVDGLAILLESMKLHTDSVRLINHGASTLSNVARFPEFRQQLRQALTLLGELQTKYPKLVSVDNAIKNINKTE
jgi:hypothetical protein